jgi:hypothetical protein
LAKVRETARSGISAVGSALSDRVLCTSVRNFFKN